MPLQNLNHFTIRTAALESTREMLQARGISFRERVIPDLDQHQLFVTDPNGITVEMVFPASESAGAV